MKTPANPVTAADAEKFEGYIAKWQPLLGLSAWRLLKGDKAARGAMADISISVPDRCAVYRLGAHFGSEAVNDFSLEQSAVHELLHIWPAYFRVLIESKCPDDVLMSAEHEFIHTLEKLLVPLCKT